MTAYHSRELAGRVERALRRLPVVVISGLRQSGKSTMLQSEDRLARGRSYRTLDDFATLAASRANPEALLEQPCVLDEVQRSPDLLIAIKRVVDRGREPGRFLLSGSANLALLGSVSETLAGRAVYMNLHPMTRREIRRETHSAPLLVSWLNERTLPVGERPPVADAEVARGGLPPACLGSADGVDEWFRGYVQTYVERDVRQLSQVGDLVSFQTFTALAALRTAQVLVIASLARDARVSAAVAARYLNLLEASFLVRRLPPFLGNESKRLVRSPKLYFTDSGLATHLMGGSATSLPPAFRGALFETYTAANLSAIIEAHLPDARLSYWHEQGRHEVDFVIERAGQVVAVEIKAASRWDTGDLSGLRAFMRHTPACSGAILAYNGMQAVALDGGIQAIPLASLIA